MYDCFRPGSVWLDTSGKRIQAHGGSIFCEDGVYYWYGENKERTDGKNGIWHWGVRCYASRDLYNWEDRGLIIPPCPDDPASPLYPEKMVDRPHILHNDRNGMYVCWLKIMDGELDQSMTILEAEHLLGPYRIRRTGFHPLGMDAGDFDLAVSPEGQAYCYFEKVHSELICADLTEDYCDVTGRFSSHFPHEGPPFVREAPAHFVRGGKHYLLTSGTTGYLPNPSEAAVGEDFHGPFTVLGDPHRDDESRTSYHSQISSVFPVPGKRDLYIALADRWVPDGMDLSYDYYGRMYEAAFSGRWEAFVEEQAALGTDAEAFRQKNRDKLRNTSVADYVWLPLVFTEPEAVYPNGQVRIEWKDEWRLEEWGKQNGPESMFQQG